MKLFPLLLLVTLAGCGAPKDCDQLIGSWKLDDVIHSEGLSDLTDKTTFLENDSVYADFIRRDSVILHLVGTYSLDCEAKELTIHLKDGVVTHIIRELTDSTMELEDTSLNRVRRMIRY